MLLHHTLIDEQGEGAKRLIRTFHGICESRPSTFITWLVQTEKLNHQAPGEAAYGAPADAIEGDWVINGRHYTVLISEDEKLPSVFLVETRKVPEPPKV